MTSDEPELTRAWRGAGMSERKIPMVQASARRAYGAPASRIIDVLSDAEYATEFNPLVTSAEVVAPGTHLRLHIAGFALPLDARMSRRDAGPDVQWLESTYQTPVGLMLMSHEVRTTRSATVVRVSASQFLEDPRAAADPGAIQDELGVSLERSLAILARILEE